MSGEMDAATSAVLDHLMIQGVFVTLVSTSPTGPVQAERLIDTVNLVGGHQYRPDAGQFVNLGYISGGASGLLSFSDNPRGTLTYTLGGDPVWELPSLQRIKALADFDLVLVATENPNTARNWIEQVGPGLGETSLIMVTSAQAEPIVRPYYDASPRQVQGMVSGLAGGVAYEQSIGRTGNAHAYWSSFSYGMIISVFLILVGGGINLAASLLTQGKGSDHIGGGLGA
jgi:hypothetical protein